MKPEELLRGKSYDSEADHPLFKKIKQIHDLKAEMMIEVTSFFEDFRKKIVKTIDKAQKFYQQKIHEICLSTLDNLRKAAEIEDIPNFQIYKYERKADRIINFLEKIKIETILSESSEKLRTAFELLKKQKLFEGVPELKIEEGIINLVSKTKIDASEPVEKFLEINDKNLRIGATIASLDKYTLNKKIDLAMPIKFGEKKKKVLLMLHDQYLAIYNDKLVLNSHKPFEYNAENIVGGVQLGRYIVIVEKHKLTRINTENINQIFMKVFHHEIVSICPDFYHESICISAGEQIHLLSQDGFDVLSVIIANRAVYGMKVIGKYLIALTENGFKVFDNETCVGLLEKEMFKPLKIIQISTFEFILITKQSHFLYYPIIPGSDEENYEMLNSNISNKTIKDVSICASTIFCLSDNGRYFFVYSF